MDWGSFIGGGLSAGAIIFGLSSWLGKVWANRILEQDKAKYKMQVDTLLQNLRTQNSKELFVHQLQFEKEFEIYKNLWVSVLELNKSIGPLVDGVSLPDISQEEKELEVRKASEAVHRLVYLNRPFYSPEIFEEADKITELCQTISKYNDRLERVKNGPLTDEAEKIWHENIDKLDSVLAEVNKRINIICDKIRQRIWSTNKSGWDRY